MKTCYVSMPFGKKTDPETGETLDFDRLYFEVVKPAVEKAGFSCMRSDELPPGVVFQRSILSAVLQSEAMIADVSLGNPSVLYELGARHALRRGGTLLLLRQGKRLPDSISYSRAIVYDLGADGGVQGAEEIRERIASSLRQTGPMTTDSPVYQFFPDLRVELAEEHATRGPLTKGLPRPPVRKREEVGKTRSALPLSFSAEGPAAEAAAESAGSAPSPDPVSFLNQLKTYRDASDWDSLIHACESAPPELSSSPEVVHLVTLALNRRRHSGDQERAIELLEKTVAEIGGGSETLGILGKIHKDRYAAQGDRKDLERAIHAFQTAFERHTDNFYVGVNLVSLLYEAVFQGGDASLREKLEEFLPKVRDAIDRKLAAEAPDYWEMAAGLHLACLAQDWERAEELAEMVLATSPSVWMIRSTVRDLEEIPRLPNANDGALQKIIEMLREGASQRLEAEVPYA